MRTEKWSWRVWNLLIAGVLTAILWFFFEPYVHDVVFLFAFLWISHTRTLYAKLADLDRRTQMTHEILGVVLSNLGAASDGVYESYGDMLDRYGFDDEADELDELDRK